jgi:hypothetical protein
MKVMVRLSELVHTTVINLLHKSLEERLIKSEHWQSAAEKKKLVVYNFSGRRNFMFM